MSFQALARTWRPRRFDQIVGQAHVVRALAYALDHNRLHHALLFSGTRGVGKTTLARIVAKCLNCEFGVTSRPCAADHAEACTSCREIDTGRFVDLIEVDAASRTGVDDTRALMDNVAYAPTRGRTKVYLIDEVHMLSKHSFNALLKTFEEPPPSVLFILATTEPEKIPVTILSRCLQFPLKRLPVAQIAEQLNRVAERESLTVEPDAVDAIARAADGSMRDGLSLLDQGLAFGGGALAGADVQAMLGTVGSARLTELVAAVVDAAPQPAMDALDALYADGTDPGYLLDALATAWQAIATIQVVGAPVDADGERWRDAAARADAPAVQVFYDIALAGIRDLAYAPDPLVGTRMTILRMLAFAPARASDPQVPGPPAPASAAHPPGDSADHDSSARPPAPRDSAAAAPAPPATAPPPAPASGAAPAAPAHEIAPEPAAPAEAEAARPDAAIEADVECARGAPAEPAADATPLPADWDTLAARLPVAGFTAQLVDNVVCERLDAEAVELALARAQSFLWTDNTRADLARALAALCGQRPAPRLSLRCVDVTRDTPAQRSEQRAERRHSEAVSAIENDPIVNKLKERLGAQVRPESIKPTRQEPRQ